MNKRHFQRMNGVVVPFEHQRGMSLVELMVGITLGIFLMTGIYQVYLSNKQTSDTQSKISAMSDSARFTLDILAEDINKAGFYSFDLQGFEPFVLAGTQDNFTENTEMGFQKILFRASDTIAVQYEATLDCLGNATPAGIAINRYYLDGTNFVCLGNGSVSADIITTGIENMQILYGEDTTGDYIANVYVNAANVTNWNDVVNVRIAILVNGGPIPGDLSLENTFTLLNIPKLGPFTDGAMRKVFTRTVSVKNHILN